jgi:hypothetical protein
MYSAVLNEKEPLHHLFLKNSPFISLRTGWNHRERNNFSLLSSIDGMECWQEPVNFFHEKYNRFMTQASVARHGQRGCSVVSVRIEV